MSEKPKERLELTKHRSETTLKIILPVLIVTLAIVGLIVWMMVAALGGNFNPSNGGSIATIWLLLPLILTFLVSAAICVVLIVLLAKAKPLVSKYAYTASLYLKVANLKIGQLTDKAAGAQIKVQSKAAGIKQFFHYLRHPSSLIKRGGIKDEKI
ncbi:MAG TPA: hypothetical protein PKD55_14365 [Bellilinea sp.]|nr:hypothetical protein [Bellilinea sp.]